MVAPNGIMSAPNFIQIHPVVLELKQMDRQTDRMTNPICFNFMHIVLRTKNLVLVAVFLCQNSLQKYDYK
jgi:hypothetical protein